MILEALILEAFLLSFQSAADKAGVPRSSRAFLNGEMKGFRSVRFYTITLEALSRPLHLDFKGLMMMS